MFLIAVFRFCTNLIDAVRLSLLIYRNEAKFLFKLVGLFDFHASSSFINSSMELSKSYIGIFWDFISSRNCKSLSLRS